MRIKTLVMVPAFVIITLVTDMLLSEPRRIKNIIVMYKKGMEMNNIRDLLRTLDEKHRAELREVAEGYRFLRGMVKHE